MYFLFALAPCANSDYVALMQTTPRVELRLDVWVREHERAGRTTGRARAEFIDMDHSNLSRIERDLKLPGNQFIASVLVAFPRRSFKFFFNVIPKSAA